MTTAADLLDSIKRARAAVTTAEAEQRKLEALLRDAKKAVAKARERAELAIEEALAERRQPSLFDAVSVLATETKPAEPERSATKLSQLDNFPDAPEPPREDYPADHAGEWEHRLATFAAQGIERSPYDLRLIELIAEWRQRQAAGQTEPDWDKWSEFELQLADGRTVRVCYCPEESDHFQFFGEATSETGYRSDFAHYPNGVRPKITLEAYALKRAEELAAELKPKARSKKARPASAKDTLKAAREDAITAGKDTVRIVTKPRKKPKATPEPEVIELTTWDGCPGFPVKVVEQLTTRGVNTIADLDAKVAEYGRQPGRAGVSRYGAMRELGVEERYIYPAGDALVDHLRPVKAEAAVEPKAKRKAKAK